MDKESLLKAKQLIIEALDKGDITQQDKLELMLNLMLLLDEENYDHDIQVLQLYGSNKKGGKSK